MFWTLMVFFFLMIRRPPRSTRTDTLVPYTTLFRSPERPRVSAAAEHWPSAGGYPSCRDMTACLRHLQEKDDGQPGSTETARPEPATAGGSRPRSPAAATERSEEHTSELQSLMRIPYHVFCLKKKTNIAYRNTMKNQRKKQYTKIKAKTKKKH